MDSQEFRRRGQEVIEFIFDYLKTVSEKRITHTKKLGFLREVLTDSAPEKGQSFDSIMEDVKNYIIPNVIHWRHPRYFAYVPCGGSYPSILADMLTSAINCSGFTWTTGPASAELEVISLDWLGKMIGLPETFLSSPEIDSGGGFFQVSLPYAVMAAMVTARYVKKEELNRRNPSIGIKAHLPFFMAYCSEASQECVVRVSQLALVQLRVLEMNEKHQLCGKTLERAMENDRKKGLIPFFVYASLETNDCSCDAIQEIGPVCKKHKVWLHVDGANAASALLCPEFRYLMKGVEFADSFSMKPSIWMMINANICTTWVQNRHRLVEALTIDKKDPFNFQKSCSGKSVDYRYFGVPISYRFRSLKLWLVIRYYGEEGLRNYIRRHIKLAKIFGDFIRRDDRFVLLNDVIFDHVCFQLKGSNAANITLLSNINASGKIFLGAKSLQGKLVFRFCICSESTKEDDIVFAWKTVSEEADIVLENV